MGIILYVGHWIFAVVVLVAYGFFAIFTSGCFKSAFEMSMNGHKELSADQKEEFIRSMNTAAKTMFKWRGILMIIEMITLALFDSRIFIIAAMVCACLAAAHFYQASRIQTRG